MDWLCFSCLPITLFVVAIGLPTTAYIGWAGYLWSRRRTMRAQILREACAVCDAPVREATDGTYVCGNCGFDMGWRDDPARKAKVEDIREIRMALSELEQGIGELELAVLYAKANIWGVGQTDLKYRSCENAEQHFLSGLSMLDRLALRYPRLAELPFPGERIGELSMSGADVNGILGLVLAAGVRRKVRDGLIAALADSRAAYFGLEAIAADLGDEVQSIA